MNKRKWITMLRWVSILPSAIIGFAISFFLMNLLGALEMIMFGDAFFYNHVISLVANVIGAYCCIKIPVYVAPSNKKNVCFILFVVFILMIGAILIKDVYYKDYSRIAEISMNIIGAIAAFIEVERNNKYDLEF